LAFGTTLSVAYCCLLLQEMQKVIAIKETKIIIEKDNVLFISMAFYD